MASAPLGSSSTNSSGSGYGTFLSRSDDLEANKRGHAPTGDSKPSNRLANVDESNDDDVKCSCEQSDCCFVMALLCAPVRLQTYRVLLFHAGNAALALLSAAWMFAAGSARLLAAARGSEGKGSAVRRFERWSLRTLLRADAALLNFVSPRHERVEVRDANNDDDSVTSSLSCATTRQSSSCAPLLYFGGAKLACCALSGAVTAAMFISALQRLVAVALCVISSARDTCDTALVGGLLPSAGGVRHFLATAAQDRDVLVLLAVLGVYFATLLLRVAAYVSRHAALYFCGDHLQYQSTCGGEGNEDNGK